MSTISTYKVKKRIRGNPPPNGLGKETIEPMVLNRKKQIAEKLFNTGNPLWIERELCVRSFHYFFLYFWDQISGDELKHNWHIQKICDELQKVAERVGEGRVKEYDLIINVPPGTTKTSICSVAYPVWSWIRWHWMKFVTAGYSQTLSLESAELSRDLIKCEKFKELFPEIVVKKDKDTKSNFKIIKKHIPRPGQIPALLQGGNRFSTSVGSTFTGFHGHIQIVDDPQDPAQSLSGVKRKTVNDWLDQTLSRRKVNQKVTPLILIMQRLHQDDATGYLLKRRKNIKHICLPATLDEGYDKLVSPAEWKRYYEDGLLDPERLSKQVLETSKVELGQYGFSGQMGQNPVSPAGGMFKTDNIGILSSTGTVGEITQMIRYWDKAGTQDGGAYTAGVKIAKTSKGKYVVMNVKKGQWASEQRERIIRTTAQADGVDCDVWIEQEPGSGGKESAESTIRNLDGFACRADRATGDKVYRADPFSVQVNNGNVFILQGDWNNDYLEELKLFPMSTFKDQVDASAGAYTKLNATKEARTW